MGLKAIFCAVALVTSVRVVTASTTATTPSSTLTTNPHVPGLGDNCDGVCRPNETVMCVSRTCQCRPPLVPTTSKYCVTAPGAVEDFAITNVDNFTVSLTWRPPTTPGVIQEYRLFVVTDGQCVQGIVKGCDDAKRPDFGSTHTGCLSSFYAYIDCHAHLSYNVTSLLSYTNYSFIISANNDLYLGVNTTLRTQTTIAAAEPPRYVRASVQSSTSIFVQWTKPRYDTGPTWYTVTVLEGTGRQSLELKPTNTYRIDGFNSTSALIIGLLPSWLYSFTVKAHTVAGDSQAVNATNTVTTLPSVPGPIEDLQVTALDIPLMGVELTWKCPGERKRNGRITSYTVNYTGGVFITQKYGIYYPEDPCMGSKTLIIPIAPGVNYTFAISSNAEFRGEKATITFHADPHRMAFLLPANVIKVDPTLWTAVIAVGVVCGVIIVVLSTVFIRMAFKVHRRWRSQNRSVNSDTKQHSHPMGSWTAEKH